MTGRPTAQRHPRRVRRVRAEAGALQLFIHGYCLMSSPFRVRLVPTFA